MHEFGFTKKLALEFLILMRSAFVALTTGETHQLLCNAVSLLFFLLPGRNYYRVIMKRIYAIWQRMFKGSKIDGERVPIQPENMISIHCANCLFHAIVKRRKTGVLLPHLLAFGTLKFLTKLTWVAWLVQRVVPCNASIIFVVLR